MNVGRLGRFIRDQRTSAKLSLRKLAGLAGVSIPYLSQIERGLRKPSADILQAIAKALRISAEQLYVQAGMLEDRPGPDVIASITADATITEPQKRTLIQIYQAFREETSSPIAGRSRRAGRLTTAPSPATVKAVSRRAMATDSAVVPRATAAGSKGRSVHRAATPGAGRATARKPGGGAASQAGSSPHPAPTRSPATNPGGSRA